MERLLYKDYSNEYGYNSFAEVTNLFPDLNEENRVYLIGLIDKKEFRLIHNLYVKSREKINGFKDLKHTGINEVFTDAKRAEIMSRFDTTYSRFEDVDLPRNEKIEQEQTEGVENSPKNTKKILSRVKGLSEEDYRIVALTLIDPAFLCEEEREFLHKTRSRHQSLRRKFGIQFPEDHRYDDLYDSKGNELEDSPLKARSKKYGEEKKETYVNRLNLNDGNSCSESFPQGGVRFHTVKSEKKPFPSSIRLDELTINVCGQDLDFRQYGRLRDLKHPKFRDMRAPLKDKLDALTLLMANVEFLTDEFFLLDKTSTKTFFNDEGKVRDSFRTVQNRTKAVSLLRTSGCVEMNREFGLFHADLGNIDLFIQSLFKVFGLKFLIEYLAFVPRKSGESSYERLVSKNEEPEDFISMEKDAYNRRIYRRWEQICRLGRDSLDRIGVENRFQICPLITGNRSALESLEEDQVKTLFKELSISNLKRYNELVLNVSPGGEYCESEEFLEVDSFRDENLFFSVALSSKYDIKMASSICGDAYVNLPSIDRDPESFIEKYDRDCSLCKSLLTGETGKKMIHSFELNQEKASFLAGAGREVLSLYEQLKVDDQTELLLKLLILNGTRGITYPYGDRFIYEYGHAEADWWRSGQIDYFLDYTVEDLKEEIPISFIDSMTFIKENIHVEERKDH